MSNHNSSLALEDIHEDERIDSDLKLVVKARHLSISNVPAEPQPLFQVVKVSGSITVSF